MQYPVNINYSNQSKTILDNSFNLNISSNMLSAMSDLFISLSGTELKADQVNLYDFSGYVLEAGISTIVKKTDGSKDEWIEVARELEGKKVLTPPPLLPENIQKQPPMTSGLFPCTDPLIININVAWV